jgi:hypothetical protein
VLDQIDEPIRAHGEMQWVGPGRYPIAAWCVARKPHQVGRMSPATATTAVLPSFYDVADLRGAVEDLVALFEDVPALSIAYNFASELADQVVDAFDRGAAAS